MFLRAAISLLILLTSAAAFAQEPVEWSIEPQGSSFASGGQALVRVRAVVDEGWHLYSSTHPDGTPNAMAFYLPESPGIASWKAFEPPADRHLDTVFGKEVEWHVGQVDFFLLVDIASDAPRQTPLKLAMRYGVCDDAVCLTPVKTLSTVIPITASAAQSVSAPATHSAMKIIEIPERVLVRAGIITAPAASVGANAIERIAAVESPSSGSPSSGSPADQGLFRFAGLAFGMGLLAIFTPCVFPMIPITMSYFISTQSGEKKASLMQATVFVVGVIALFTGLGAAVSVILGPFGMQTLGANVWVNLFIALIFFAFSASLLGAFEISMPSAAVTSLNRFTQGSGVFSTLMMGLVFALASFACTGPFVGALLASSVSGGGMAWPIFGMLMFSTGLALPFFFLALFPSYLGKLPKSGGWLGRTKITMGFLVLAAGFKYLSNVDQMYQLNLLPRDRFLAIWAVIFGLAGVYLLGFLKIEDEDSGKVGLGRLAAGAALLALALSLIPGMFGSRLGELDAYVPSAEHAGLSLAGGGEGKSPWLKDDYAGALAKAAAENKNVLISFTGYSCTNCKWMKTNMFPRENIAGLLEQYVVVELYTDGIDDAAEVNQTLQLERYKTAAIPFYAIVGPDGAPIVEFAGRTTDEETFRSFLSQGLKRFLTEL
ncbi:MAG: thioredoxin family protein [Acidobacteria bacterium]|nr:thioredoxin family protein [Acidobacteriota bacterium]